MLIGSKGYPISYECSELIAELKKDIRECGKDKLLAVWLKEYKEHGIEFAVNYDFVVNEAPIEASEIEADERLSVMTAESLLDLLIKQNDPVQIYDLHEPHVRTIKELRTACDMTQKEFSEYFGIPKRTIEDWEAGRRKPSQWAVELIEYKLEKEGLI